MNDDPYKAPEASDDQKPLMAGLLFRGGLVVAGLALLFYQYTRYREAAAEAERANAMLRIQQVMKEVEELKRQLPPDVQEQIEARRQDAKDPDD